MNIQISFKGKKTFDTLEEAKKFIERIGTRYKALKKCTYPDMTFYIVEFTED